MKHWIEKHFTNSMLNQIFISFAIAAIICATLFFALIPSLLNYAPGYSYIDSLHGLSFFWQFFVLLIIILILGYFIIFFCLRGVKEIETYLKNPTDAVPERVLKMRKRLLDLPYQLYIIQIAIPVIIVTLASLPLFISENASLFVFLKLFGLLLTYFTLVSIITLIISQRIFKRLLLKFDSDTNIDGIRLSLAYKMYIQILPLFLIAVLYTSLMGYSNNIREKGNLICEGYVTNMNETFAPYENRELNFGQIQELLYSVKKSISIEDTRFIITPDKTIITSDGEKLGEYFLEYMQELSMTNGGYAYDTTEEVRGYIKPLKGVDGEYIVGIKFNIASTDLVVFYILSFLFILFICLVVLYFLSKALSEDILTVAKSLSEIASGDNVKLGKKLSISSNDEIADLVIAFNKIQGLVQNNIKQIRDNHEILIQHERLASLGQLIGGIAHSLKTPISTASDATICIENLAEEYDGSIDNNQVTKEDHHSIASEIKGHAIDLKETLSYINSIINTVKNHSADLESSSDEKFIIRDLIKSINILMSNELKKYSCRLTIETDMNEEEIMRGDMRSLIQIINVLISNAIQSYPHGNGQIDFVITKDDKHVRMTVRDYGIGIPLHIQDKILNKMVTTRGNKGTGIGLYISNSIIKAKFNGSLSFESEEGKGTTFHIILPIRNEEKRYES